MMRIPEIKKQIASLLKPVPGLVGAYLHGSVLTDYFRQESDIDIALLFLPRKLGKPFEKQILSLGAGVEDKTGHWGHFSFLSSDDLVFARQVVTTGELIVCRDSEQCSMFTMHTLSMYADFNLERKEILESYTAG